ncbi:hypothetical protein FQN49_004495 [Arthroderma sp. PD_2]|nr:hypothetical protein FQN49_004495 [Arthroderma sp. PD_2]
MAEAQPQPTRPSPPPINCQVPDGSDRAAPAFPDGPDLFKEVEWGPFPSDEDITKAYKVWSIPNATLTASDPSTDVPSACLARNVYESILASSNLPISEDEFIRHPPRDSEDFVGWTYSEIFGTEPEAPQQSQADRQPDVLVQGRNVLTDTKYWTKAKLLPELHSRGINVNGLVPALRQRLYDDELQKLQASIADKDEDKGSIMPLQDLSDWGIRRAAGDYMVKITSRARLSPLDMYTWAISLSPYNPTYWTSRAYLYYQMGHFDLAIGDAYRAQILCEKLANPLKRHVQPGLYIRIWDAIERHILQITLDEPQMSKEVELLRLGNGVNSFITLLRKTVHHIIVLSLLAMQCWEDYAATEPYLRTRLVMADRDKVAIQRREAKLAEFTRDAAREKRHNYLEYFFERHYGFIKCRQYPYDSWDAATAMGKVAKKISKDMINKSQAVAYRPQQIQVEVDIHRLAVYADEDIPKGAVIYVDEPSIRGHLQHVRKPSEHRCENCKRPVRATSPVLWFEKDSMGNSLTLPPGSCECANCFDAPLYWCTTEDGSDSKDTRQSPEPSSSSTSHKSRKTRSRARSFDAVDGQANTQGNVNKKQKTSDDAASGKGLSCLEIARSLYHNRVCGKDWNWLHNAMRPCHWLDFSVPSELGSLSHTNEKHGTLLSLLLREVFDITLLRRKTDNKPNLLAYEIDELMPIMQWSAIGKSLPFSFAANIQVPFNILSCLGVNIFRDFTFDTWVIQLALRKLLMSAIPWHPDGEERDKDIPEHQKEINKRTTGIRAVAAIDVNEVMPTFPNLYVFPVVSLFQHACPPHHNVDWNWDTEVPNRVILHAKRDIRGGEELSIRYSKLSLTNDQACRLFSRSCDCTGCGRDYTSPDMGMPSIHYGDITSEDEGPDTPPPEKPKGPYYDPNPPREPCPESSQDGEYSVDDEVQDPAEERSNESDQSGNTEEAGQGEVDDYQSSSQEGPAPYPYAETYQPQPGVDQYQPGGGPLNSFVPQGVLAEAQRALELMPTFDQANIPVTSYRPGQGQPRQQPQEHHGFTPVRNPMAPSSQPDLESSPDYTNIQPLQVPRQPLRPGGARVRHNGVMMTSTEYNLMRMREAMAKQSQEQKEQQEQEQQQAERTRGRYGDGDGA